MLLLALILLPLLAALVAALTPSARVRPLLVAGTGVLHLARHPRPAVGRRGLRRMVRGRPARAPRPRRRVRSLHALRGLRSGLSARAVGEAEPRLLRLPPDVPLDDDRDHARAAPRGRMGRRRRRDALDCRSHLLQPQRALPRGRVEVPHDRIGRDCARASRLAVRGVRRAARGLGRRESSLFGSPRTRDRPVPAVAAGRASSSSSSATERRWASRRCTRGSRTPTARRPGSSEPSSRAG